MRSVLLVCFLVIICVVSGQYSGGGGSRCPTVCPLNYDPICAKVESFQTFSNACQLNQYICQNRGGARPLRRGECRGGV